MKRTISIINLLLLLLLLPSAVLAKDSDILLKSRNFSFASSVFYKIPPRPANAVTGSQFAKLTAGMSEKQVQKAALNELRQGNIPGFLRILSPVILTYTPENGTGVITARIQVMPDYLAIGSDNDFLRIPLSYPSAVAVASEFGCILPTRKMVDAIYEQSDFHYVPQPLPAGPRMRSMSYHIRHQKLTEIQGTGRPLGELVSGHKKDVVLTSRLWKKTDRVAIYGWHKPDGEPIQSLSTVHGFRYADYSHGVRLVSQEVLINGSYRSIHEILENENLAPVLSYEGGISNTRELMKLHSAASGNQDTLPIDLTLNRF